MAGKVVLALSFAKMIQHLQRLSLRMESFARTALKTPGAKGCLNHMGLVFFGKSAVHAESARTFNEMEEGAKHEQQG